MKKVSKHGGCHCGKVKFVVIDEFTNAILCNCSVCTQKGFIHLIVKKENFKLLTSMNELTNYQFETKTASHLFCKTCGISSFYIPRSHPDGFSVNLRCVEGLDLNQLKFTDFDGKNWEQNIHKIK